MRKMQPHLVRRFQSELLAGDGQLGPVVEDIPVCRVWDTHELGSNGASQGGSFILCKEFVRGQSDYVFGVDEESVHVENTGADYGDAGGLY